MINPLDLADLLEREQYEIDEDTGEVIPNPNRDQWELLLLASQVFSLSVKHCQSVL